MTISGRNVMHTKYVKCETDKPRWKTSSFLFLFYFLTQNISHHCKSYCLTSLLDISSKKSWELIPAESVRVGELL